MRRLEHLVPASYEDVRPGRWPSRVFCLHRQRRELSELPSDAIPSAAGSFRGVALLGLADDEGVVLNGGRPGARHGPSAFRGALARYGAVESALFEVAPPLADAGDLVPGLALDSTHERVTQAVSDILEAGWLPVGVGGGHDLSFPFVRALAERVETPLHGIYCDAHLDVREEKGSGMPFRRLVEDCRVASLTVLGLDEFATARAHREWFLAHGGRIVDRLEPWPERGPQFVSLDLDVLDQSQAPGVSAPNPCGRSVAEIAAVARAAGRSPQVACFDLMELSPPQDEGDRTARVAVRLFLEFLRGLCERRSA